MGSKTSDNINGGHNSTKNRDEITQGIPMFKAIYSLFDSICITIVGAHFAAFACICVAVKPGVFYKVMIKN